MTEPVDEVIVLLREGHSGDTTVHAVFADRAALDAGLRNIERINPQYSIRQLNRDAWRIGPDEDEGFFGNHTIHLRAVAKRVRR